MVVDQQTLSLLIVTLGLGHDAQHALYAYILQLVYFTVYLVIPEVKHLLAIPQPFDHVLSLFQLGLDTLVYWHGGDYQLLQQSTDV